VQLAGHSRANHVQGGVHSEFHVAAGDFLMG
jgi:hypothetical protein